jgi:long-chain acyl-CoA synthetase
MRSELVANAVESRMSSDLLANDTFPKLLKLRHEQYGDRKIAMRKKDRGIWQAYTWEDYYNKVKYFSLGLISLGLQKGDRVSILGENDPEWYWADLAIQAAGAIAVGVFVDCTPPEVKYYAVNSESRFILAHDQEQVDKVLGIKSELPLIEKVIYWDPKGLWFYDEPLLMSFNQVLELGEKYEETNPRLFEKNVQEGSGDDVALILYTSGTGGLPKGAVLAYNNILKTAVAFERRDHWSDKDNYVSCLPPAWINEHTFGIAGAMIAGYAVSFPEDPETVQEDIRDIGASTLMYSPRLWETVARSVQARIMDTSPLKRFCYNLFMPVGYKLTDLATEGERPNLFWRILYTLGNWVAYRPLKDKLGMLKIKNAWTGGAAISPDIIRFFRAIGINLKQGYGSSEVGSSATSTMSDDVKLDTVGVPVEGSEVRISGDGEILLTGLGLFGGYYNDPQASKKSVRNSWFHTGDFGYLRDDGQLIFIDRLVDLRPLSTGEKFSPQYAEIRLRFSPYIKDVLVLGDEKVNYVCAIINIDKENVGRWAEAHHIPYTTYTDLSQKPGVIELVAKEVERVNSNLPPNNRIRKFVNLHKEFDPDEAELTRTRKLRRTFVEDRFRDIVNAIYEEKPAITVETPVTYQDGRVGIVKTALGVCHVDYGDKP